MDTQDQLSPYILKEETVDKECGINKERNATHCFRANGRDEMEAALVDKKAENTHIILIITRTHFTP